ncbi:MAG: PAS domain S-box protein [Deltaproteobacteria bacterium]|nr:PAS domain S-box protein [Deltaproteobacteria bacterium]
MAHSVAGKQRIAEKQHLLEHMFDTLEDGLIILDGTGIIEMANASAQTVLGCTERELVGKCLSSFYAQDQYEENEPSIMNRLLACGEAQRCEMKLRSKNNKVFTCSIHATLIKDRSGTILGGLCRICDAADNSLMAQSLQEAEEKYRIVADFTCDWETWVDPLGNLNYISPSCKKITGYSAEEFLSDADLLKKIILPEEIEEVKARHQKALKGKKDLNLQYRIRRRDGRIRWIECTSQPVMIEGRYRGHRASNRDITDRKEAENSLRQSEERCRNLTETATDAIITADSERRIVGWNKGAEKIYGFKAGEALGRDCSRMTPARFRARLNELFSQLLKKGAPFSSNAPVEGIGLRKDGSEFIAEQTYSAQWIGTEAYVIIIVRDITQRKELEKRLYESEELLRLSFENAPFGIAIFDPGGALMRANSAFQQCLGRTLQELQQQGLDHFLHYEDRTKSIGCFAAEPQRLREHLAVENRYFTGSGTIIYISQHMQGVFGPDGDLRFIVMLIQDITDTKRFNLFNVNIIKNIKGLYLQLQELAETLPDSRQLPDAKSLSDYALSPTETRIAAMIYHGYTNEKIARQLCISVNTVKHHITSIYATLNVGNRLEFISTIRENRIVI